MPVEEGHFGYHFTKTILTRNLGEPPPTSSRKPVTDMDVGKVLPGVIEELEYVLPQNFPSSSGKSHRFFLKTKSLTSTGTEWTPIEPSPAIVKIISSLTARVFGT
jgi:hypothetical protein